MIPIPSLLNARDGKQDFQHHAHKKLNRLKKKTLTNWHCILQSICGLVIKNILLHYTSTLGLYFEYIPKYIWESWRIYNVQLIMIKKTEHLDAYSCQRSLFIKLATELLHARKKNVSKYITEKSDL